MSSFTNPIASFSENVFTPDGLVLSLDDVLSRPITLVSGQANVARGAILGAILLGAATSAAKGGGNTGTGTLVLDAAAKLARAQAGIYTVRCTLAQADGGVFTVSDPNGAVIGEVVSTLAGTTFADRIKFVITTITGHDFIVGDGFDITVAAGALDANGNPKYAVSLAAAVDGSQTPDCILVQATDATGGDAGTLGYFRGRFSSAAVTLGAGQTIAAIREGLRGKGVDLVSVIA